MPTEQEVLVIYAGTKGYLDDIALNRVQEFQNSYLSYVQTSAANLLESLSVKKALDDEIEGLLKKTLEDFKSKVWKK